MGTSDTDHSDNCPEICTQPATSYKIKNPHKKRILIAAASLEVQASMEIRADSTIEEQSCDAAVTQLGPAKTRHTHPKCYVSTLPEQRTRDRNHVQEAKRQHCIYTFGL